MVEVNDMAAHKVLCKVFHELGIGRPDMNEFKDRIRYQKTIYLLQNTGLSLGYGFGWYLKSPYCSELSSTLYYIFVTPRIYERSKKLKFNRHKEVMPKLHEFRANLGASINDDVYMDALACMHYIDMARFSGKGSLEEVSNWYFDVKPRMREKPDIDSIIEQVYNDLDKYKERR
jgi:uncharacterized protein YwgA